MTQGEGPWSGAVPFWLSSLKTGVYWYLAVAWRDAKTLFYVMIQRRFAMAASLSRPCLAKQTFVHYNQEKCRQAWFSDRLGVCVGRGSLAHRWSSGGPPSVTAARRWTAGGPLPVRGLPCKPLYSSISILTCPNYQSPHASLHPPSTSPACQTPRPRVRNTSEKIEPALKVVIQAGVISWSCGRRLTLVLSDADVRLLCVIDVWENRVPGKSGSLGAAGRPAGRLTTDMWPWEQDVRQPYCWSVQWPLVLAGKWVRSAQCNGQGHGDCLVKHSQSIGVSGQPDADLNRPAPEITGSQPSTAGWTTELTAEGHLRETSDHWLTRSAAQ